MAFFGEKRQQYNKAYYQAHKSELLSKYVTCNCCNKHVKEHSIGNHMKSKKHIDAMKKLENSPGG